jgi:mRNA-degrading endonuclease RelE of RelBE toxin-antitoxin system
MTREFILMPQFEKNWKEISLGDPELRELQIQLTINPKFGEVVRGTGGLRKLRFKFGDKGKRGSARIVYVDFQSTKVSILSVHTANQKRTIYQKRREMKFES